MEKRAYEKVWTDREVRGLSKAYHEADTSALAERFGRTREAIRVKAKRIGAQTPRRVREKPWTAEEIELIQNKKYTAGELGKLLGRSRSSILSKWWYLRKRNKEKK